MGTNYYWHSLPAGGAHRGAGLHVGKASAGWCFALHVYPDRGVEGLGDWIERFRRPDSAIRDEYREAIPVEKMLRVICQRSWAADAARGYDQARTGEDGPSGLLRRPVDGRYCVGHGMGTWDLCVGEFS